MNRKVISTLAVLLLGSSFALGQKPKIATIDAKKATAQYHLAKSDFEAFEAARLKLEEDPRKKELDGLAESLKKKIEEFEKMSEKDENRSRLGKEIHSSKQDYDDLFSLWRTYRLDKLRELTEDYASKAEKRGEEIISAARKLSDSKGFDWVVETSGATSSKMPVVLYVRNSTDITEELIAALNKDAPAEVPAKTDPE